MLLLLGQPARKREEQRRISGVHRKQRLRNGGNGLLPRRLPHGGNILQSLRNGLLRGARQHAAILIGGYQHRREHNQCVEMPAAQDLPYRLHESRIADERGGVARPTRLTLIAQGNRPKRRTRIDCGLDERRVEMPDLPAVCRGAFREQPYANPLFEQCADMPID